MSTPADTIESIQVSATTANIDWATSSAKVSLLVHYYDAESGALVGPAVIAADASPSEKGGTILFAGPLPAGCASLAKLELRLDDRVSDAWKVVEIDASLRRRGAAEDESLLADHRWDKVLDDDSHDKATQLQFWPIDGSTAPPPVSEGAAGDLVLDFQPVGGVNQEYVELTNGGKGQVALKGLSLVVPTAAPGLVKSGANIFHFAEDAVLGPGKSIQVNVGAAREAPTFGSPQPLFYGTKDRVELRKGDDPAPIRVETKTAEPFTAAPPSSAPDYDPGKWRENLPFAGSEKWVGGYRVRYAVSFYKQSGDARLETAKGPWWSPEGADADGYFGSKDYGCPYLVNIPVDPSGEATGRKVYRQFAGHPVKAVITLANNTQTEGVDHLP